MSLKEMKKIELAMIILHSYTICFNRLFGY